MRDVHEGLLFVGNAVDARDLRLLNDREIRAVVDLAANERPAQLSWEMIYLRIPLLDGDGNSALSIRLAIQTLSELLRSGHRTLVACSAGMSRSPAIAAAALAVLTGATPELCLRRVIRDAPRDVAPPLWAAIVDVYNDIVSSSRATAAMTIRAG